MTTPLEQSEAAENRVLPFVDGAPARSDGDKGIDVINPSTGRRLFRMPAGSESDANRAALSARRAFDDGRWSESPPSFKKKVLLRFADLINAEAATLDALDAQEMGKPISTAFANAASAAGLVRFCGEAIDKLTGDVHSSDARSLILQRRVPRGVVAAIVPWNFPTSNAVLKIAPALAAGNCVVLKPSELSSRSAVRLAQLAQQAGLPDGVLNVVPGVGETVGRALGVHTDVDMVAFTGSTGVGKLMLQYAGQSNMKVVQAECGGKSPQIVFADGVDLDAASSSIAGFLLTNQGQICSVGSRLLVERSIERRVVDKIVPLMGKITMGDALEPNTTFGPLVSQKQRDRVIQYIEGARRAGAELVVGGKSVLEESGGYYVEPTLFRQVAPTSSIAQEEVFGPVLSVTPFDTIDEAIRLANSTRFGLSAYVWTANLSTGMKVGKSVRSMVLVNAVAPLGEGAGHATSWEPSGQSGIGAEGGLAGIETYLRRQLIWFSHA